MVSPGPEIMPGAAATDEPLVAVVSPLVLIISGDAALSAVMVDALRSTYRVACAVDGPDGLQQTQMLHPDLVLCDMTLPQMSGEAVVIALRRLPSAVDLPVIMLTERTDEALRVRLFKAGIQAYLDKPFSPVELTARVGGLLTLHKRTRMELLRYEHIVATSGNLLLFVDTELRYVLVNPAYADLIGVSADALCGRKVKDVLGADTYANIGPRLDKALAGEKQQFTNEVTFPNGRHCVMDVEYCPFWQDGKVAGVVVSLRDITELKASQAALKASEERLRLSFEATNDGLWDWDIPSGVVYRAPRYIELTGYPPEDVTPDFDFLRRIVHPEDLPYVMERIQAHLQGHTAACDFEFRLRKFNGDIRWMKARGRAVKRDDAGTALRMVGTLTDITDDRMARHALAKQTVELAQRNAELERFNKATVGRELDMIALKRQVNALSQALGRPPPFALAFTTVDGSPAAPRPPTAP